MWNINMTTILYLMTTGILFIEGGINGRTVSINNAPTGQKSSNGTYIECLINMDGVRRIREVSVYAAINGTMTDIITFKNYGVTNISAAGGYLKDRVTYNTITEQSNRTELRFDTLLCEDDTYYQCLLLFEQDSPGPSVKDLSEVSHLTVTVPPSRPSNLAVKIHKETYMVMSSHEHVQENLTFVEGDTITATCTGEVGKPPANITMQKILSDGTVYNLTQESLVNYEIPNCSFIQRSSFNTTLAGEDQGSYLRCAVEGTSDECIETSHFDILYPVRIPDVNITPYTPTRPPVMLHCQGRGNPDPDYTWFKLSNNSLEPYASDQRITLYNLTDSGVYMCEVNNSIGKVSYRNSINITVTFEASANKPDESTDKDLGLVIEVIGIICGILVLIVVIVIIVNQTSLSKKTPETLISNERRLTTRERRGINSYYSVYLDDERDPADGHLQMKEQERAVENEYQLDQQTYAYAEVKDQTTNRHEVIYAQDNKARHNDHYASGSGLYDQANDRRHKESIGMNYYDTTDSINNEICQKHEKSQHVVYAEVNKTKKVAQYQKTDVHQPVEYAQVNKIREKNPNEVQVDNVDDHNLSRDGLYGNVNDRLQQKPKDTEKYDADASVVNRKSGKQEQSTYANNDDLYNFEDEQTMTEPGSNETSDGEDSSASDSGSEQGKSDNKPGTKQKDKSGTGMKETSENQDNSSNNFNADNRRNPGEQSMTEPGINKLPNNGDTKPPESAHDHEQPQNPPADVA